MSPIPEPIACPIVVTLEPCASELRAIGRFPTVPEIDRVVSPRAGVRFESAKPKSKRPRPTRAREPIDPVALYDGRITKAGVVPTRPGSAHDLWNALVWSIFPRTKRAIHARQHRLIAASLRPGAVTLPPARTREQDTIAMIDEGGVVLLCDPGTSHAVENALAQRTKEALLEIGAAFTGIVFGHAIYEELARGPSRVLGFSVVIEMEDKGRAGIIERADAVLSGMLADPERFLSPEGHRGVPVEPDIFALAS